MKKEKAMAQLDRMTEFSLWAFVFTLPFSKSMVEIFFVCALTCWVAKRCIKYSYTLSTKRYTLKDKISELINAFKPVKTGLNRPIAGFILIGLFSTVYSTSLPLSLEGFFFKLFEWIMIYFIAVETINSKKKLTRILLVIFFSMILIGTDAIFQRITGTDFIRHYPGVNRISGPFGIPNSFAGWLVVMIPIALSLAYLRVNDWLDSSKKYNWLKRTIRPILWIIIALFLVCLVWTNTRGAWVAVVLSLIFFGIFRSKRLLVLIVILALIYPVITPPHIKRRVVTIFRIKTLMQRPPAGLWNEALNIIRDYPAVGCGLNTYATVAPNYKISEKGGIYPHNSYLHMAAESGLLGLGTFLWIVAALFMTSLANLKRIRDRSYYTILIGLLGAFFGFLVHSFVDVNIYALQLGNLMWFIMGLIIAVQKISLRNEKV